MLLHWTNQNPPRLSLANRSLRGEALRAIVLRSRQTSPKGGRFGFNLTAGQSNEGTSVEARKRLRPTPMKLPNQSIPWDNKCCQSRKDSVGPYPCSRCVSVALSVVLARLGKKCWYPSNKAKSKFLPPPPAPRYLNPDSRKTWSDQFVDVIPCLHWTGWVHSYRQHIIALWGTLIILWLLTVCFGIWLLKL